MLLSFIQRCQISKFNLIVYTKHIFQILVYFCTLKFEILRTILKIETKNQVTNEVYIR